MELDRIQCALSDLLFLFGEWLYADKTLGWKGGKQIVLITSMVCLHPITTQVSSVRVRMLNVALNGVLRSTLCSTHHLPCVPLITCHRPADQLHSRYFTRDQAAELASMPLLNYISPCVYSAASDPTLKSTLQSTGYSMREGDKK